MTNHVRLCLAQENFCVGDIDGNTALIVENIATAKKHNADVVAFPELAVTGYPPEDLLFRPGLHRKVALALEKIGAASQNIHVIVGYPELTDTTLYNSAACFADGKLIANYRKQQLPNYAVFDEKRYFVPGDSSTVLDIRGIRFAVSICEDIWVPESAQAARDAKADAIININASPYRVEKRKARMEALGEAISASGLPIAYVNLLGGQDELVFDGGSLVLDERANVIARAPEFERAELLLDITQGSDSIEFSNNTVAPLRDEYENIYSALVTGVRDYVLKNRFKGVVLGLSGGIDSALTLAIAVDAIGAENVHALSMPSRYTADMSINDALKQCENMGCACDVISIEHPFKAFNEALAPVFADYEADVTEENIQARCRGLILMAVSNKTGRIVLATGNKSEMAVGYATLYGDMCGGFAPIKDVPKTLVYALAKWRNTQGKAIPERVITREPSAELRDDQKDSDSLPAYEILDPILEKYIELDMSPSAIAAEGYDLETVERVARMVDRNEYKRRQAAPGVRISARAFGRDRRYPITSRYQETE
ncbi:MAG: NAD+ synthase [Pseudomonadota bacterium]